MDVKQSLRAASEGIGLDDPNNDQVLFDEFFDVEDLLEEMPKSKRKPIILEDKGSENNISKNDVS
tara:strand:+ start:329 stop:523 length:195 start_codon:yes stop_codon:yes gene_type:complete